MFLGVVLRDEVSSSVTPRALDLAGRSTQIGAYFAAAATGSALGGRCGLSAVFWSFLIRHRRRTVPMSYGDRSEPHRPLRPVTHGRPAPGQPAHSAAGMAV